MPRRRQFKEFEVEVDMALLEETRKLSRPERSGQVIMSTVKLGTYSRYPVHDSI